MKIRILGFAWVLGLALACGGMTPEERAAWEKEQQEKAAKVDQDLQKLAETLTDIDRQLSARSGFQEVRCDAKVVASLWGPEGYPRKNHSAIRRELLTAFSGGPFKGTKELSNHLSWMNSAWLVKAQSPLEGVPEWQWSSDKRWILERMEERAQVLAVYIPVDEAPAKVAKQDGLFTDGSYDGGYFDGWLTLWNLQSGEFLCSTFFSAESSSSVSFDDRGLMKTTFEEAVAEDFDTQVQNKARDARERLAPELGGAI